MNIFIYCGISWTVNAHMNLYNTVVMIWMNYIAKTVAYCGNGEKIFDGIVRSGMDEVRRRRTWYSQISTKNLVLHQYNIITNINTMSWVSIMIQGNTHKLQLYFWLCPVKNLICGTMPHRPRTITKNGTIHKYSRK